MAELLPDDVLILFINHGRLGVQKPHDTAYSLHLLTLIDIVACLFSTLVLYCVLGGLARP